LLQKLAFYPKLFFSRVEHLAFLRMDLLNLVDEFLMQLLILLLVLIHIEWLAIVACWHHRLLLRFGGLVMLPLSLNLRLLIDFLFFGGLMNLKVNDLILLLSGRQLRKGLLVLLLNVFNPFLKFMNDSL
jgi:hypothetical protein